jgi:hypothetical protein
MSSAYLPQYVANAELYLDRMVPSLSGRRLGWEGVQELCTAYRQRAACWLLLRGTARPFQMDLMRSSGAFLHHLKEAGDDQKVTSHAKPFFDALGAGCWDCAAEIARHSRMRWSPDAEYEEDFLYVSLLMKRFFLGADLQACEAILERIEEVIEGGSRLRLDLCRALLARDTAKVDEGVRALLDERSATVEGMIARGTLPEELWSWLRYFASEGLAILRLAAREGISLRGPYPGVPEVARTAPDLAFAPDAWMTPGSTGY